MLRSQAIRSPLVHAAVSIAVLAGAYVAGCDSETEEIVDQTGKQPPARPEGAPAADGPGYAFAVSKLFLGGTTRTGSKSKTAWKDYGYNLDFKISTAASTDVCKPNAGGKPSVHDDGNAGVDNAFGKELWPIIEGLAPTAEGDINDSINQGEFTIILNLTNLGDEASYVDVLAKLYAGTDLGGDPTWDGSDMWPVAPELLSDPMDIESAKVQFPESYLNNNVWVSGSQDSPLTLSVNVQGFSLALQITRPILTMNIAGDRSGATDGIIAGIIEVETLISELKKVAGSFSQSLCEGTTFDSIANQLRQAADIMSDGSQDPGKTCDGISIGLGFESLPVQLGEISEPSPPAEDPCMPGEGGAGGAGGMGTGGAGGMGTGGMASGGAGGAGGGA